MVIPTINPSYCSYEPTERYHKSTISPTKSLIFLAKSPFSCGFHMVNCGFPIYNPIYLGGPTLYAKSPDCRVLRGSHFGSSMAGKLVDVPCVFYRCIDIYIYVCCICISVYIYSFVHIYIHIIYTNMYT